MWAALARACPREPWSHGATLPLVALQPQLLSLEWFVGDDGHLWCRGLLPSCSFVLCLLSLFARVMYFFVHAYPGRVAHSLLSSHPTRRRFQVDSVRDDVESLVER